MVQYLCTTLRYNHMYMSYTTNPQLPKVRAQAVELVRNGWSTRQVARHLGYSHSSVVRWSKRVPSIGRREIPTRSSRPHSHPKALSLEIVKCILEKRKKRNRCAEVVHRELLNDGYTVSLSSVKRTLKKHGFIKRRSPWKRWHFSGSRPLALQPGSLVQIDTIHVGPCDEKRLYTHQYTQESCVCKEIFKRDFVYV
jgi:transposase